jgi:hypothetical protein
MTPEETQRLQACLQEAGAILYRNTPARELKTLEGLEKAVRQQMLEQVGPEIAFFYQTSYRNREGKKTNRDEHCGQSEGDGKTSSIARVEAIYQTESSAGEQLSALKCK